MLKRTQLQTLRKLSKKEYEVLQRMCHLSKNLYNETLYEVRQYFFNNNEYLNYYNVWGRLKNTSSNYDILPSQAAQQTMKHVDKAFQSFFKLLKHKRDGKYNKKISPPNYLKKDGYYSLIFPNQSFQMKEDYIRIGVTKKMREKLHVDIKEIKIPFTYQKIKDQKIQQLQIIPKSGGTYFEYALMYEIEQEPVETDKNSFLSIDVGVDNLATCVDNSGCSFIIDGRKLKSINRFFNREKARLQSIKAHQNIDGSTIRLDRLYRKRKNIIHDYLNKAVNYIVQYCIKHKIETVLIGDAGNWKNEVKLGKKNNQNFVYIPFAKFKQKLKHKLEYYVIGFELVNEKYTSKCSFFDDESIEKHGEYSGKRIHRGLFKTNKGYLINADVNAALNIAKVAGKLETRSEVESSGVMDTPKRIRNPFNTAQTSFKVS